MEPNPALLATLEEVLCKDRHKRHRFNTLEEAIAYVRQAKHDWKRTVKAYPCHNHWHLTSRGRGWVIVRIGED